MTALVRIGGATAARGQKQRSAWHLRLALIALLGSGTAIPLHAQIADTLLLNGRIVTLDATSSIAEAMAVQGDKIVALGPSEPMRALAGPRTRVIDLGGRTVIPGLIDSHIHAIRAGLHYTTEIDWTGAASLEEALSRIRAAARTAKPGAWLVVAGGWTPIQFAEARRPSQEEIKAVALGHPVYLQLFYREAFLSPEGFAALGIRSDGDLPPHGKIEPGTGWISGDGATITRLYERLPKPDFEASLAGTKSFMRVLNRFGLTGVLDPGGLNLALEDYRALFELWQEKQLTLRVVYSIFAPRAGHELEDFQTLTRFLPMQMGDDMLRFNGIGECITWGMYNNDDPSEAQKEDFYRVARWAADQGLTLTVHWNNNRSVHHLLEVFERVAREHPIAGLRWSIAHLSDASDESLQRMQAIGVGWLMQDGLYFASHSYLAERGPDRLRRAPPIRTAARLGLPIGGGTDANRVMSYNPFISLRWMLDGKTVDGLETRSAAEFPSREEALRIYTQGSAWFGFDETRRGRLAPGMLADIAVLSADYFAVPLNQMADIQSVLTMVGGRIVYAAGPFSGLDSNASK